MSRTRVIANPLLSLNFTHFYVSLVCEPFVVYSPCTSWPTVARQLLLFFFITEKIFFFCFLRAVWVIVTGWFFLTFSGPTFPRAHGVPGSGGRAGLVFNNLQLSKRTGLVPVIIRRRHVSKNKKIRNLSSRNYSNSLSDYRSRVFPVSFLMTGKIRNFEFPKSDIYCESEFKLGLLTF